MVRQPVDENDRLALDRLRARRDRMAHEIEMMKNDADHWNRVHRDEEPLDVEALLAEPRKLLAAIDAELGL